MKLICVCPEPTCGAVREVHVNSAFRRMPKDAEGRVLKQCKSCSKTHDFIDMFPETVAAKRRNLSRRKVQRIWSICYRGRACQKCGLAYDGKNAFVFDFHHREPHEKEFDMSQRRYSFERLQKELDKCDLLCASCHRAIHSTPY